MYAKIIALSRSCAATSATAQFENESGQALVVDWSPALDSRWLSCKIDAAAASCHACDRTPETHSDSEQGCKRTADGHTENHRDGEDTNPICEVPRYRKRTPLPKSPPKNKQNKAKRSSML